MSKSQANLQNTIFFEISGSPITQTAGQKQEYLAAPPHLSRNLAFRSLRYFLAVFLSSAIYILG
ncbi:MAG: hypothetical protein AUF67_09820 [Acidobacteria bacterium 13_1_20CM_58_21]|nr:MAG: hypothetical protein AUF67_09820 [Acidobacteria bacterium 13_1_20CM_58_21]